jgi:Domain of unknown function (DUF202)
VPSDIQRNDPQQKKASLSDYLAAERTLLAWIRTGQALMGFGFVVARFGLFLQQLHTLQSVPSEQSYGWSLWFGTALLAVGNRERLCRMAPRLSGPGSGSRRNITLSSFHSRRRGCFLSGTRRIGDDYLSHFSSGLCSLDQKIEIASHRSLRFHSLRSACIGSTDAARRAGRYPAVKPIATTPASDASAVHRSYGPRPNNIDCIR